MSTAEYKRLIATEAFRLLRPGGGHPGGYAGRPKARDRSNAVLRYSRRRSSSSRRGVESLAFRASDSVCHDCLCADASASARPSETPTFLRIFSTMRWFNAANESGLVRSQGLLKLAVAFETLLRLPESSKTDRLVDAISLLLGRTERLGEWAQQFYDARSRVAHEGEVRDQYFYPGGTGKRQASGIFGSLMLYGRQIFQLCLSTLLVGIDLAERANLRERFVSNNERFQKLCELLQSKVGTAGERLLGLAPTVRALEHYRFVGSVIDPGPQLTAARLASLTLADCNESLPEGLASALAGCAASRY
jgi:hypothetical protein